MWRSSARSSRSWRTRPLPAGARSRFRTTRETASGVELGLDLGVELNRQAGNLVQRGYPALAGLDEVAFLQLLTPLEQRLADIPAPSGGGRIPFLLVVSGRLTPPERAIELVTLGGREGFTEMPADDLDRFRPIDGVDIPAGAAWLVTDVDAGGAFRNVTPDDALETITGDGRSPLTIDEGMALVTQFPEVLRERTAFSMLGSRCGDRRVTAMWISRGRPRLGWCWAGNPHAWLGSASCGARLAA